jgi:hypothetical protein
MTPWAMKLRANDVTKAAAVAAMNFLSTKPLLITLPDESTLAAHRVGGGGGIVFLKLGRSAWRA